MSSLGSRIANYDWRRLITVVCLSAFVLLTIGHACHHFAQPSDKATWSVAATNGTDDGGSAAVESVCSFCAQVAEELTLTTLPGRNPPRILVETAMPRLSTRPVPAEFPPPIA